jgi:catechol 2,3-dioxygenase-like lactoylglutathione lyase family enzyme
MSGERPPAHAGLRHLALNIVALEDCERFYVDLLGFRVEWRPDPDNVYLSSGMDNLALHRANAAPAGPQRLDHLGVLVDKPEYVDAWHDHLVAHGVAIKAAPRTHRDGARSFYCYDPDGNLVQVIHHPPLSQNRG